MPMIGLMPALVALFQKSYAPYMFPWSVMAIAAMPSASHWRNMSFSRAAPSSIEYSVCTCRCANDFPAGAAMKYRLLQAAVG